MSWKRAKKFEPFCSECKKPFREYNNNDVVCSDECARVRKTRLQQKRRDAGLPKDVLERRKRMRRWRAQIPRGGFGNG
jgi:hypothetical protein